MSSWTLAPQEVTPEVGAFTAMSEVVITRAALDAFGEEAVLSAIGMLARHGIAGKLDYFQVLRRGDGARLYAVDEEGRITLMLPEDW
ncbi:MAG: hypothetical protein Q8O67_15035 [Deltaproteobacteria bacterium]|nr:hypothetical protein [Deltaproteobacteria bacterium]